MQQLQEFLPLLFAADRAQKALAYEGSFSPP
jgi:hypothetical protein